MSQERLKALLISGCVLGEEKEWHHCAHCNTYQPLLVYLFAALQLFKQIGYGNQTPLHPSGRDNRFPAAPLWAPRGTVLCIGTSLPTLLSPTPQCFLGTPHPMHPYPPVRKHELGHHASPASPSVASALRAPRVLPIPTNFCCTYAVLVFLPE